MAQMRAPVYHKLQAMFAMYEEGRLKGQKEREMKGITLQKALEGKLAPKLYHFKIFQGIDVCVKMHIILVITKTIFLYIGLEKGKHS